MKQPISINIDLNADLALKGYTKDPDWMFKTGLGGTITAASALSALADLKQFLYLPVAIALGGLVCGFILRTARKRLTDPEAKLADWNHWLDLFMSGITWLAIQFGIIVLAAMILTSGLLLAYYAILRGGGSPILVSEVALLFALLIFSWTSLLSSYLMINFAAEEKLAAGFAFRKVLNSIRKEPRVFLTAWMLALALQIFALIAPAITLIGIFLVPSAFFAAQIVGVTLLTQAWRRTIAE